MNNLLRDPIIRTDDGRRLDLPTLVVELLADRVQSYVGMRGHQEDAFHAAIVQICGYALHATGHQTIPTAAKEWRSILAGLTDKYPSAWHLYAPCGEPAFFQPPADDLDGWALVSSPAMIDPIRPCKEFDVKRGPAQAELDQWLFALVALQTTTSSNSPHFPQTSRMSGGYSSRLFVSLDGSPGQRFRRDLQIVTADRSRIVSSSPGYAQKNGLAFTWLAKWGTIIPKRRLDPLYLDTPRRVRLVEDGAMILSSPGLRTEAAQGGLTGDPWAPVKSDSTLVLTNLTFRNVAPIITGNTDISPALLQEIRDDDADPIALRISVLTGGQPAKSRGFHRRVVPIPRQVRSLLRRRDQRLEQASKERMDVLDKVQRSIYGAIMAGLQTFHKARRRALDPSAKALIDTWFLEEDSRFFNDLWQEIASTDVHAERRQWLSRVLETAQQTVRDGCKTTISGEYYWCALATAEIVFRRATAKLRAIL